ncbi:MAG: hypothetical protein MRJ68_02160 [Nitrospira sp.]|nr:hypothetical protein [Nitrospira sp.]
MIVRFYKLTETGAERIGEMILREGQIILNPPNQPTLLDLIESPYEDFNAMTGERRLIDQKADPEAFLKSCLRTFRGSYFWCKKLPASTGPESAEHHRDTQEG